MNVPIRHKKLKESVENITIRLTKKKNDFDEYEVKVFVDGKFDEAKSYYSDDYDDALGTFKDMAKRYNLNIYKMSSGYKAANKLTEDVNSKVDWLKQYTDLQELIKNEPKKIKMTTYDLKTLEPAEDLDKNGFMLSFFTLPHQYTKSQFRQLCDELFRLSKSKSLYCYVGGYDGQLEVSACIPTRALAIELMQKYSQWAVWGNKADEELSCVDLLNEDDLKKHLVSISENNSECSPFKEYIKKNNIKLD